MILRSTSLLSLFLILMLLVGCKKDQDSTISPDLFGVDWFVTQRDAAGNATYVPAASAPLSLGQSGFRFESSGTFVEYMPAPADGTTSTPGTWTTTDGQTFTITVNPPQAASYTYDLLISAVSSTGLTARRLP